ncbi:MAG: hypothetical protein ACHQD9_02010 [Chitinophagales bacterium]
MQLSDQSRVWIYLSSREFDDDEVKNLNLRIANFCREWSAHGANLAAQGEVLHHRFIVLMVDETRAGASGCSIDSSVHFIQSIEREFNTQLFDRMLVPLKDESKVKALSLNEVKQMLQDGMLTDESLVFNTLVQTKEQLDRQFIIPIKESWLSRFIPQAVVNTDK